jgi:hypothetical protein
MGIDYVPAAIEAAAKRQGVDGLSYIVGEAAAAGLRCGGAAAWSGYLEDEVCTREDVADAGEWVGEKECVSYVVARIDAIRDPHGEVQVGRGGGGQGEAKGWWLGQVLEPCIRHCEGLSDVCHNGRWPDEYIHFQETLRHRVGIKDADGQVDRPW